MKFLKKDYKKKYNIKQYSPAPTEFDKMPDDSIPLYWGAEMYKNPDRGFRGELKITLGTMEEYPNTESTAYDMLKTHYEKYREEEIQYYQLYVYLTRYSRKDIDEKALLQLTEYMQRIKELNIRVLLRFAYKTELASQTPSTLHSVQNMKTLKKWFEKNKDLVNSTVYAMQLGMIGLWGEGHSNVRPINKRKIVKHAFEMIPDGMTLTMRHPKYISLVPEEYENRASLHDDFLIGKEHPWGMIPFNHIQWNALINKCKHSFTDGEMPWGRDTTVPVINHIDFLCQCRDYGLSTLSIEHNYKEDGNAYHLMKWKDIFVTENELIENKLPYFPASLKNGKISVFDYLNAHLGFVPCLSNLKTDGKKTEFDIYNFGMGSPVDYRIVLKSNDKKFTICEDMSNICQFTRMHFETEFKNSLEIRIERKNAPWLTYRLANNIEYKNGWNKIL